MTELGQRILAAAEAQKEDMIFFLMELASMESPSDVPESQIPVQAYLTEALEELGFEVERTPGKKTGGHLLAKPKDRDPAQPSQLLLGHCDTVWKLGTLETMPVVLEGNRLSGPGVLDMKAGLTQIVFSLKILGKLGLEPDVTPWVLVNSDEEIDGKIRGLTTTVPGTSVEVKGGLLIPPLERTPRNRALWEEAVRAAEELGLELDEGVAGGGSDGNTTSQFAATLDGIGAVGDGAHATHEFLFVDKQVERCALLARLILLRP